MVVVCGVYGRPDFRVVGQVTVAKDKPAVELGQASEKCGSEICLFCSLVSKWSARVIRNWFIFSLGLDLDIVMVTDGDDENKA